MPIILGLIVHTNCVYSRSRAFLPRVLLCLICQTELQITPKRLRERRNSRTRLQSAESAAKCVVLEPTPPLKQFHAIATMDARLHRPSLVAAHPPIQPQHHIIALQRRGNPHKHVRCLGGENQKSRMPCSWDATPAYTAHGIVPSRFCNGAVC